MAQKPLDFENPKTLTRAPSGLEIAFFEEPRRAYAVRAAAGEGEWAEVPSVTTVLDVLDKPGLPWWGQGVAIDGMLQLYEMGVIRPAADGKLAIAVAGTWVYATQENVTDALTQHMLTVNHTLRKAGDRGQGTHDAFEAWASLGVIPDPSQHPMEERMYVEALRKFCVDMGDAWETEGCEIAVASVEHGFAGRYDLRGKITKDVKLTTRALTLKGEPLVRGPKYVVVPEGTKLLLDLKTSKSIYGKHLMQLEAYEGCAGECGYEPTDARAVVHVTKHGLYQFKRARATFEDFLAILHTYRTLQSVEEALRS
jgi:hypothetical protein